MANHTEITQAALADKRPIPPKSLAVLAERLERVKQLGGEFLKVCFSENIVE